jgi:hypothetical protein
MYQEKNIKFTNSNCSNPTILSIFLVKLYFPSLFQETELMIKQHFESDKSMKNCQRFLLLLPKERKTQLFSTFTHSIVFL